MNFAWVIDQSRCIGCHACSTACKSENDVPLGVYRTWVKNVEVGSFPNVRRHFAVLRCNHCADPPCVHICPVHAMHQRPDGIVDIDHDRCIGCKACIQACPYDAIHIDPTDDTAAKCHFCAHRIDRGLLPACVVVCPVEALLFGDLDDANSRVSQIVGSTPVTVRRPEQGTRPKAFYVGAHQATLDPLAAEHEQSYMWADRKPGTAKDNSTDFSVWGVLHTPGEKAGGVSQSTASHRGKMPKARVAYDVPHNVTWKGKVSAYLWTKSIAAGVVFMAATRLLIDSAAADALTGLAAPIIALLALAATGVLLIADLKRPERFWHILAKPQWGSWLTRGAVIISAFGAAVSGWLAMECLGMPPGATMLIVLAVLGTALAIYTAFLFGQCEARDLWQSPLLVVTLALQMAIAGASALLLTALFVPTSPETIAFLSAGLIASLAGHAGTVLLGEVSARHGSSNAAAAAAVLVRGRYAGLFWMSLVGGTLAPALILVVIGPGGILTPLAAGLSLIGLWMYEHAFVMAGQAVPIS